MIPTIEGSVNDFVELTNIEKLPRALFKADSGSEICKNHSLRALKQNHAESSLE